MSTELDPLGATVTPHNSLNSLERELDMNTTKEEHDLIEPWEQEYKEYLESQECEEDDEYEDDEGALPERYNKENKK